MMTMQVAFYHHSIPPLYRTDLHPRRNHSILCQLETESELNNRACPRNSEASKFVVALGLTQPFVSVHVSMCASLSTYLDPARSAREASSTLMSASAWNGLGLLGRGCVVVADAVNLWLLNFLSNERTSRSALSVPHVAADALLMLNILEHIPPAWVTW